jgi:predicted nucleic acid-binding protein
VIVLDASVVVDLLLDTTSADSIRDRLRAETSGFAAPHHLDAEVGQVLRRFVLAGKVTPERALDALEDLALLPLTRYALTPLLARAFALHNQVTVYDGLYIALAEGLKAPLLTRDAALAKLTRLRAHVEHI